MIAVPVLQDPTSMVCPPAAVLHWVAASLLVVVWCAAVTSGMIPLVICLRCWVDRLPPCLGCELLDRLRNG